MMTYAVLILKMYPQKLLLPNAELQNHLPNLSLVGPSSRGTNHEKISTKSSQNFGSLTGSQKWWDLKLLISRRPQSLCRQKDICSVPSKDGDFFPFLSVLINTPIRDEYWWNLISGSNHIPILVHVHIHQKICGFRDDLAITDICISSVLLFCWRTCPVLVSRYPCFCWWNLCFWLHQSWMMKSQSLILIKLPSDYD